MNALDSDLCRWSTQRAGAHSVYNTSQKYHTNLHLNYIVAGTQDTVQWWATVVLATRYPQKNRHVAYVPGSYSRVSIHNNLPILRRSVEDKTPLNLLCKTLVSESPHRPVSPWSSFPKPSMFWYSGHNQGKIHLSWHFFCWLASAVFSGSEAGSLPRELIFLKVSM
jgi:hypothetical protein